jgi:FtsH-binding integral membrane protein
MTAPAHQPPPNEPSAGVGRDGLGSNRVIASLLLSGAGLLTIVAPFLSLFVGELHSRMSRGLLSVTGWATESVSNAGRAGRSHDISSAPVGYPLLFAGALLAVAAVIGFRTPRAGTAVVRLLPAVGATFLVATVTTVGMQGIGWAGQVDAVGISTRPGAGFWLLIVAAVVAVVAALLPQPAAPIAAATPSPPIAGTPTPPS